jgi:REP element-mobilizing transposase RayT
MVRYQAGENLPYFCTITILDWVPIFMEHRYIDPLIDSLAFCRANKGPQLFAYVVMPDHVHLIAAADDLHALFRDFQRFTALRLSPSSFPLAGRLSPGGNPPAQSVRSETELHP